MQKKKKKKKRTRWQSKRICTPLLLWEIQNYNSPLNHQQENVGSHQKKTTHIQGQRRSPSNTVGRAKSPLESNPIHTRDAQRAQKNLVRTRTHRPHRGWGRTVFEYSLGFAFLWDWNENWPFPVLWPLLSFPSLLAYWVQHLHSIIF